MAPETGLKTYRAASMADALTELKRDLGPDAVILRTRTLKVGGVLGLGARSLVEITASADPAVAAVAAPPRRPRPRATETMDDERPAAAAPASPTRALLERPAPARTPATPVEPAPVTGPAVRQLQEEMRAMRSMMAQVLEAQRRAPAPAAQRALGPWAARLAETGLPHPLADRLASAVEGELSASEREDDQIVRTVLARHAAALAPTGGRIEPTPGAARVVALVGPTGVGKTTTIAKLAADLKLRRGLRVGLITADTYRIAAVEQLRTYAGIIGLPLRVALSPEEMAEARRSLADHDVVLVDTAGRSPRDAERVEQTGAFLDAARADEVHLVLSAAAGARTLGLAADRFAPLGGERLRVILSKVDEGESIGAALGVAHGLGCPVSYLTTGQEVPDDVEPATGERLAGLLLGAEVAGVAR